jgi:hypothetical protein
MSKRATNNSGSIFKNDFKKEGSAQPDYRGVCNIEGKDYDIAAWVSETRDKKKYFSIKFSEPYEKKGEVKTTNAPNDNEPPF